MTEHSQAHDAEADVAWVRATLGPSDPARLPVPAVEAPAGWSLALSPDAAPRRRRVLVATSLAVAAALVTALVAVALIGRGGGRSTTVVASNPNAVLAALDATTSAPSAQGSFIVTVDGTTVLSAKGTGDLASGDADLTLDLPAPLGPVEVRSVGNSAYVQLPSGLSAFAGGKPWVQIDRPALEQLAGRGTGLPALGTGFDFTSVLEWLRGVGQVTPAGSGTSHGDPTADYHAVIDLTKAAALAPAGAQGKLNGLAQAAGQAVPVDISLDSAGRLRRLQATFDFTKVQLPAGTTLPPQAHGVVTATLELWGFGSAVQVVAPPADQVSNAAGLLPIPLGGSRNPSATP